MRRRTKDPTAQVAVIVDNTGRLRAHFITDGAKAEADSYLNRCKTGKVEHLMDATVVTGEKAKKALENGRI